MCVCVCMCVTVLLLFNNVNTTVTHPLLAVRLPSLSAYNEKCQQGGQIKVYQMWRRKVFCSRALSIATKVHIFRTLVLSVLLYGAETWTVTQHDIHKLKSFQMHCLPDILGITLWNQVQKTDILERTRMVPVEEQLRQRCLQWFGHVRRMPTSRSNDSS